MINVIDWERARIGPALSDLLWLVVHWSYTIRNVCSPEQQLRCFKELFLDPTCGSRSVAAVRQVLVQYMSRLSVDPRLFPLLLVLTWVEHGLDHTRRLRAVGGNTKQPRSGNPYVQYVGILAEHPDRLFNIRYDL